ncbi:hypothetical protein CC86DRAFT_376957 [Ophiobolus disseminans]|uniref:Uncharacterized protein n=1 Tax=Ophiobolus disseminans TaxID=1469910 RepID=A0A6A7AL37_9PLEO|nr:hypothetical protein CC86DRAFT_376957 [Ophiobolus disseminans]
MANPAKKSVLEIEQFSFVFHGSWFLLRRYAPQFATALDTTEVQQLDEVTFDTFNHFDAWLKQQPYLDEEWDAEADYDDEDFVFTKEDKNNGILYLKPSKGRYMYAGDSWLMAMPAIKYNIALLQQDAIDRLVDCCTGGIQDDLQAKEEIAYVYANTVHGSQLRRVLVDAFCCRRFDERENRESMMGHPEEFLIDIMFGNAHVFNTVNHRGVVSDMGHSCGYHGHARMKSVFE